MNKEELYLNYNSFNKKETLLKNASVESVKNAFIVIYENYFKNELDFVFEIDKINIIKTHDGFVSNYDNTDMLSFLIETDESNDINLNICVKLEDDSIIESIPYKIAEKAVFELRYNNINI